jgi:3-isopropylmalate/(R)-2-methylmalate dehydratase small subunit
MKGIAFKFGDDISTDLIAPGRYFHLRSNLEELARHVMEDADPQFPQKVKPGDFIVAGKNFGCGSSREHAPRIIKMAGVSAVIAKSFARIFYRNAVNIGLPVVECDTDKISNGDEIKVHLSEGMIKNISQDTSIDFRPLPHFMVSILNDGGLVQHIKKHHGFAAAK